MDIKSELDANQTILLLMPDIEYNDVIVNVVNQLSAKRVIYVTLNKTHDSLKELFQKNKINVKNLVFIDGVSKTIKKTPDTGEGVYFCSSPGALTEISLAVNKFLKYNFDYLIFDSLTSLLVYQKKAPVSKFVSSLVNKIKKGQTKTIFYALNVKEQDTLIKESSMFVDKVIEIGLKTKSTSSPSKKEPVKEKETIKKVGNIIEKVKKQIK